MKIDEIHKEWETDGHIDITSMTVGISKLPFKHNKYYKWYSEENLRLKKMRADFKILQLEKIEWLRGEMDIEDIRERGWTPFSKKLAKSDVQIYLDADPEIITMSLRIGMQEEVCQYLESIIRQLNSMNYLYKTIVDYEKFKNGIG